MTAEALFRRAGRLLILLPRTMFGTISADNDPPPRIGCTDRGDGKHPFGDMVNTFGLLRIVSFIDGSDVVSVEEDLPDSVLRSGPQGNGLALECLAELEFAPVELD